MSSTHRMQCRIGIVQRLTLISLLLLLSAAPALADSGASYQLPPQAIVDMIDAPQTPNVTFGPDPELAFLVEPRSLISVAELAQEELRLAGIRFKPDTLAPSRITPAAGLRTLDPTDGTEKAISGLPEDLRLIRLSWSPDGKRASFVNMTNDGGELWLVDAQAGTAKRLTDSNLHLVGGVSPAWLDAQTLIAAMVPEGQGEAPKKSKAPTGPVVQDNDGRKAGARTYQDLLANAHDEALFEHYLRSQLVLVGIDGKVSRIGEPDLYRRASGSPDGRYLLVETLHRPFSYLVPAGRFPLLSRVWGRDGETVKVLYDRPLQESIPLAYGSVATGPRSYSWRDDAPSSLVWVEALDEGDAGKEAELRDRLWISEAPFDSEPRVLAELDVRYGGTMWSRGDLALVNGWWWKTRTQKTWAIHPDHPDMAPRMVEDRSWEDRYNDPGNPTFVTNEYGRWVLQVSADGKSIFRIGSGASPEGDRPFLDRVSLDSGEATRLFRSEAPYYERPIRVLDGEGQRVLTRREAQDQVPNYFVRNLADGTETRVTDFPHPTPQLLGIQKELVKYEREDGVQLSGTLYTPPEYDSEKDGPLPMVMWAYPNEFKSADAAGQVSGSPHRFDRVGWWSQLFWLTQGYAVFDDPTMPIIGEGEEEPNDTFRSQLVSSAKAAVDEMVDRGVAKPGHIAVGGHSYGAFMTANLLAHSDLFAAGIARSGAYNRTLTPFGFQSEERTFWEAPDTYFDMSPFMHAEKVNEPILLIHGAVDNNPGTFPIQSERYFNALKSHGAVARLVMLPEESHGYRARESILHMLWETHRWLEKYVSLDLEVGNVEDEVKELPAAAGGE